MSHESFSDAELSAVRELQRIAYDAVGETAASLRPGVTEREASERIGFALRERGVTEFFHVPFAWFGDRSAFRNFRSSLSFFSTSRRLEPGMAFILDVAPIRDRLSADVGLAGCLGPNAVWDEAAELLRSLRGTILGWVRAGRSLRAMHRDLDALLVDAGFENRHRRYPFATLGHRVGRVRATPLPRIAGFDGRALIYLARHAVEARLDAATSSPIWNASSPAERLEPGLWAIEPHIARGPVGAKWEEILVVTESDAHWLDEDLPHVRMRSSTAGVGLDRRLHSQASARS
jgi:Xaa-Pro aminopeptidase